jgi:hypothetical protein
MLYGLRGLGDDTAAAISSADALAQIAKVQAQIKAANDYTAYVTDQYQNHGHFGGQTQDWFNAFLAGQSAKVASLSSQIDQLNTQIQRNSDSVSTKQAADAVTATLPAQQAAADKAAADALDRQMRILMGPRYDYGRGSAGRNAMFNDLARPLPPAGGLGIDWASVITSVAKTAPAALKGASVTGLPSVNLPGVSLPDVQLPSWLQAINVKLPNAGKVVDAVKSELAKKPAAAPAAPAPAAARPQASSSLSTLLKIAAAGVGGYVLYHAVEGAR